MKNTFAHAAFVLCDTALEAKSSNDAALSLAFTDVSNLLYTLSQSETLPTIDDLITLIESSLVGNNLSDPTLKNTYVGYIKYIQTQLPVLLHNQKGTAA
jgi:hypothetical protein